MSTVNPYTAERRVRDEAREVRLAQARLSVLTLVNHPTDKFQRYQASVWGQKKEGADVVVHASISRVKCIAMIYGNRQVKVPFGLRKIVGNMAWDWNPRFRLSNWVLGWVAALLLKSQSQ